MTSKHSSFPPDRMSSACYCFNPEDCEEFTDGGSESADMPPLLPAGPLFSAGDVRELKELYDATKRDRLTAQYQEWITRGIDQILIRRGATLKDELAEVIEGAGDRAKLEVKLVSYSKVSKLPTARAPPIPGASEEENRRYAETWDNAAENYCFCNTTKVGSTVELDFLVRETHFLRQLVERIGDPQHFIIKKRVSSIDESGIYKTVQLTLYLEFWPKGVTLGRRIQCAP